jgi:hypothetical protein
VLQPGNAQIAPPSARARVRITRGGCNSDHRAGTCRFGEIDEGGESVASRVGCTANQNERAGARA